MRQQFPNWFTPGARLPTRGDARSLQQTNDVDCGIYVIENALAFDEGEESALEVYPELVRLVLARRFADAALEHNPTVPSRLPRDLPKRTKESKRFTGY